VIYRALSPWQSVDPYGPSAQDQLMITNLRVRLLQRQPCPCQAKHPGAAALPTDHYAIYDFIVKGSCLCNGHADHCVPARSYQTSQQRTSNMVHGKCVCRHNTAGDHCERCAPLHNDQPWQAANGLVGTPHQCQRCKCNGHARSCHFSRVWWLATGRQSGGVCDSCRHNTEGRHCQSCKTGFYRDPTRPKMAPDSCKQKCDCVEVTLGSPKLFCAAEYDYVLVVKVMSAHDKGSHAEVEVKVKKVLYQSRQMKIQRKSITLYPESWTTHGCTCPILNPGSEYVVAGHEDWNTGTTAGQHQEFR
ncbi:unnamed protein product, partial [Pleuronectes platessa]